MANRTSLRDRQASDARGVDAIITPSDGTPPTLLDDDLPAKALLAKVTIYVRPEQVLAVEEIQLAERKRTGRRKDKSDLYQEALDLLMAKYGKA